MIRNKTEIFKIISISLIISLIIMDLLWIPWFLFTIIFLPFLINYKNININKFHILSSLLIFNWIFTYKIYWSIYNTINEATKFYNEEMNLNISSFDFTKNIINNNLILENENMFILLLMAISFLIIEIILIYIIIKNRKKLYTKNKKSTNNN